jgi:PKD repeat protein
MSAWKRAAGLVLVASISACGGGGGGAAGPAAPGAPVNTPPTANFAFSCVDLACTFTSTSTDQDVGDAIVVTRWQFGDGTPDGTSANPAHTFASANTYNVTLGVADRANATSSVTRQVVVTAPPAPPGVPHANFTASCASLDCTFTDTSTYDAGSVPQSRSWDFGDSAPPATTNPASHHYAATALTTFSVKLTVVDTAGKTSTSVQSIVVAPPATTLNCGGGGNTGSNCVLTLTQPSRVTATLLSHSCGAKNNQVIVTAPVTQTLFADGCFDTVGVPISVNGGQLFAAGTTLQVEVLSGTVALSTLVFPPTIRVTGDFASGWTLTFDDGFGGPGEPDFNDLIILVKAGP